MNEDEFKRCLQALSKQEEKILKLFLNGKSDVEIAKKVNGKPIMSSTVKCHISRICSKFDLINEGNSGYDHRDELIDLFIHYKGEWVSNDVRTLPELGYPRWEDPDSNRHIERTGSNFYLEQVKRCRDNAQVIRLLEKAVKGDRSDPYAQIYLNNAKARLNGITLKIGVVVAKAGNDFHEFASTQVLRGVADAQTQFNESRRKGERWLEIDIRNDGNNESDAKAVAQEYINDPKIIAVFGHHSSEATKVVLRIYEEKSVALISPTSTK
jgi:hypothetical protein